MIIGKGGSFIKQIKEESGAYVQISQKSRDHALAERCITVIGDFDQNKKACAMIIQKIVEDPQSGSCLNVSYADVTGPVANFNPTGSPYANAVNSNGGNSQVNNNNTSYSSNGSLNSLSPTLTNSFNSPQGTGTPGSMLQFSGMGLGPLTGGNPTQMIDNIRNMLRNIGYTEDAIQEICAAMTTLANYGMLGLGLGLQGGLINSINGAPTMISGLSVGMAGTPNSCGILSSGQNTLYPSHQSTGVPGLEPNPCNNVSATSAHAGAHVGGNGIFSAMGTNPLSGIGISHHAGFSSPTHQRSVNVHQGVSVSSDRLTMPDGSTVFDPFRRSSPVPLGSPGTTVSAPSVSVSSGPQGPLPINNNSFGLGTGLHSPGSSMRKSPTPTGGGDPSMNVEGNHKMEVEIGDNIVGAILGHGGKSLVEIQRISGANIQISKKGIFAPGTRNRIVTITGSPNAVQTAQYLIDQQITEEESKRARQNQTLGGILR